jgi:hypothetical protein
MRSDDIVPFAMKFIGMKIDPFHLLFSDFAAGGIFAAIQSAGHGQAFGGCRLGNEVDHGFVVMPGLAPAIRREEGKEAVLDLVPLARPGRKMTHQWGQAVFIREFLQLQFPQAQAPAIAPSSLGRN